MDRSNAYRKKSPYNSSASTAFDSKRSQDEKIILLQGQFPSLPPEALGDILAAVDWNVDRAIDVLQDTPESQNEFDRTDIPHYDDRDSPYLEGTPAFGTSDTFLEIIQSQNLKTKPDLSPVSSNSYQPRFTPTANVVHQAEGGESSHMFPALPQAGLSKNYFPSSSMSNQVNGTHEALPSNVTDILRDYNPIQGKMTVYNALQDSIPSLRVNESSWKTDFNKQQVQNVANYLPGDYDEPNVTCSRSQEDVLHDDDISTKTDGEDWFSLQLEPQFVVDLFNSYSNPFGAIESERLLLSDLKIRIPPKLAFDLFRHLCLNLLQKFPENSSGSSGGDSFEEDGDSEDYSVKGSNHFDYINVNEELTPNLKKIMELEMRLEGEEARRVQLLRSQLQSDLATKLTIEHLKSKFPSVPIATIEACFVENNAKYDDTFRNLQVLNPNAYVRENITLSQDKIGFQEAVQSDLQVLVENTKHEAKKTTDTMTPTELRLQARTHFFLMREYMQKRAECSHAPGIAEYYSEMSRLHADSMREANRLAADLIFAKNNRYTRPNDHIDLHELSVQEAINRLVPFLRKLEISLLNNETLPVKIICGRGKHSDVYGPKIGPAVVNYLHKNGYEFRDTHRDGYIHVNVRNKHKSRKLVNGGR